jgi:hypothetical protein
MAVLTVLLAAGGAAGVWTALRSSGGPPSRKLARPAPEVSEPPYSVAEDARLVASLPGPVWRLAASKDAIYAGFQTGRKPTAPDRIARLDPDTGKIQLSDPFQGSGYLALTGGFVWAGESSNGGSHLLKLDPTTMHRVAAVKVQHQPGWLVAGPRGLWVGDGNRLLLIDPASIRTLASVQADGSVGALTVDTAGRFLYDMTYAGDCCDPRSLEERDARTGALILRVTVRPEDAPVGLATGAAIDGGVWVSIGYGHSGAIEMLDQRTLTHRTVVIGGEGHPEATEGVQVNLTAGVLWVADRGGELIFCGDPTTGHWRAAFTLPKRLEGVGPSLSNVVQVSGSYYVGTVQGIVSLGPEPVCRG